MARRKININDLKPEKPAIRIYDSIAELHRSLKQGETTAACKKVTGLYVASQRTGRTEAEWTGSTDYEDADNKMMHGDRENFKKIEPYLIKASASYSNCGTRTTQALGVVGYAPCVPASLMNLPNSMITSTKVPVKHKVKNICYMQSASVNESAEDIRAVGVAVINYILGLEAQGIRCNVYIVNATTMENQAVATFVKIKSADQHLDRLKMTYPIVNPSMLRRHSFRDWECNNDIKHFADGYGKVLNAAALKQLIEQNNLHFDMLFSFTNLKGKEKITTADEEAAII